MNEQVNEREKQNQINVATVLKPLESCHMEKGGLFINFLL